MPCPSLFVFNLDYKSARLHYALNGCDARQHCGGQGRPRPPICGLCSCHCTTCHHTRKDSRVRWKDLAKHCRLKAKVCTWEVRGRPQRMRCPQLGLGGIFCKTLARRRDKVVLDFQRWWSDCPHSSWWVLSRQWFGLGPPRTVMAIREVEWSWNCDANLL